MTYKDELCRAMRHLGCNPRFRFMGYNIRYGSKANGTLKDIPEEQLVETPVAENLIVGLALGYAFKGTPALAYIERFDFVLNAADALVNHVDKIKRMSHGQFNPTLLIRTVVGNSAKPLFTGLTHTQDFSESLSKMLQFPVVCLRTPESVFTEYAKALDRLKTSSTLLVEYRDAYELECATTNTAI